MCLQLYMSSSSSKLETMSLTSNSAACQRPAHQLGNLHKGTEPPTYLQHLMLRREGMHDQGVSS